MEKGRDSQGSLRVLYVGGAGRSGSTLVGRVLGAMPGAFNAGELMFIWRRGVLENQLCGCGEGFLDCSFWTAVGQAAFGGWDVVDANAAEALRARLERTRRIPALAVPRAAKLTRSELASYCEHITRLYSAISDVSGAAVIVDTSKGPPHALVLRQMPLDLRICLLVRDSRGVAYSWTRRKPRPEIQHEEAYMDTYSSVRSTVEWVGFNSMFELGRLVRVPIMRMRYEDFVNQTEGELNRIAAFARLDGVPAGLVSEGVVSLAPDHSVAGNPMRFTSGRVPLAVDDEWRRAMPASRRRLVSVLTGPWLWRYGYLRRT
ncbi:MAG TPA: sulfotransferase [Mycobacteriales bacterium]|nr:sulfotransferase [Mycobacteriales bacterium]